jgi:hypothetical protein
MVTDSNGTINHKVKDVLFLVWEGIMWKVHIRNLHFLSCSGEHILLVKKPFLPRRCRYDWPTEEEQRSGSTLRFGDHSWGRKAAGRYMGRTRRQQQGQLGKTRMGFMPNIFMSPVNLGASIIGQWCQGLLKCGPWFAVTVVSLLPA